MRNLQGQMGTPAFEEVVGDWCEEPLTRYEPQVFDRGSATPPVGVDPYTAWLDRRDAEREPLERAPARWVHKGPMIGARKRALPDSSQSRWVHKGPVLRDLDARGGERRQQPAVPAGV